MAAPSVPRLALIAVDVPAPRTSSPGPAVTVTRTRSGSWLMAEIAGELDLQAVPLLAALGGKPCFVVLDLHGVTFMDCSSLRALVQLRCRAVAAGGSVRLVNPSGAVVRLLGLTGLERAFPAFDTVMEATALTAVVDGDGADPVLVRPRTST